MSKAGVRKGPLWRAITIVGVVGALASGVTYAALQSPQATLSGNTIQTASANLLIGTASATSSSFAASHSGFTFSNVIPGGPAVPAAGYTFYLKNTGTVTLNLKLSVGSTPVNAASIELSKVTVSLTRVDTGATQTASLQSLIDGYPSSGLSLTDMLAPSSTGTQYQISISMTSDAYSGTGINTSIGSIDFVFSGSAAV